MASAATLELIIKLNNKTKAGMKGFEKSIKSSSKALKDARSGLDKMGDAAKRNRTKLLAVGAGVAAIGVLSIKSAADFQKGMAEVNTLINVSQDQINALGGDVRELSKEFGINAVDATKALYQTISAGIEPAKALEFLGIAAKTSIGGITDLETAVDGLTTVVNAFGFDASESEHVADILFETMRRGKTTIGELSDFMFQAAPVSAALGVSFEEMTASIATLTKQGTPTRVAMTGVRQAIISLAKPTEDMSRLLQIMGFDSGLLAIETLGLQGTFEALATKTGATETELVKAVGSVEALTTVLGITGKNAEIFREDLDAITNSAGAMGKGFDLMEDTTSQSLARLQSSLNDVKIQIGEELLPIVTSLAGKLTTAADAFGKLPDPAKTAAVSLGGAAGAVVALGLVLPPFLLGWRKILAAFTATKGAVSVAIGALGTATAAVLGGFALAAGAILFFTRNAATSKDVLADFRAMVAEVAEKTLVKIEDQLRQVAFGFNDLKDIAGISADAIVQSTNKMAEAFAESARAKAAATVLIKQASDIEAAAHKRVTSLIKDGIEQRAADSKVGNAEALAEQAMHDANLIGALNIRFEVQRRMNKEAADFAIQEAEKQLAKELELFQLRQDAADALADRNAAAFAAIRAQVAALPANIQIGGGIGTAGAGVAASFKASQNAITDQLAAARSRLAAGDFGIGAASEAKIRAEIERLVGITGTAAFRGETLGALLHPVTGGPPPMLPGMGGGLTTRQLFAQPNTVTINIIEPTIIGNDPVGAVATFVTEAQRRGMLRTEGL